VKKGLVGAGRSASALVLEGKMSGEQVRC